MNDHLEKGKKLLAIGQLADALTHFHSAIGRMIFESMLNILFHFFSLDVDPKNYIAYFRRAAVYLGMGKSKAALPDLSKVIELKPDFTAVSSLKKVDLFYLIYSRHVFNEEIYC